MQKLLITLAILLGIILLGIAGLYATTPAHALPHFMPGYNPLLTKHHYTHAGAAAGLGLICFAFAWFATGKRKKSPHEEK